MYVPTQFAESRPEALASTMRAIGHGVVVTHGPDGLVATHAPIEVAMDEGTSGRLRCHFTRPNPHVAAVEASPDTLVVFSGPHRYVSPSWYPSKRETGKVVPTLNYVAVHAYGTARTFDDRARLRRHVSALSDHFEADAAVPWSVDDAPDDFIDKLLGAIIGIEVEITRVEGKRKASQNRGRNDRAGVAAGLRSRGAPDDIAMAALVEATLEDGVD